MSEGRTDRVREILDLAMERPTGDRAAFVAGAAGGDEQVRDEVMSLLGALEGAGDALEPPGGAPIETMPAEPLTGLCFGPYVVGERIGEGGMGVVYATRDTRLDRTVAVKSLPPGLLRDPYRRARLEREARVLASLNHPNIGSIFGIDDTPRGPVMILEFVPGRTLAEEIAARRLSVQESVAIARQIARGLESAHGAGIVHRDLKPANIKLTPEGAVKILDLGVAKAPVAAGRGPAIGPAAGSAPTLPGVIVGTAAYMSPEQARGRPVDRRTDLWALGCVVYEMLAGERAFDGETDSDAVAAVLMSEPDWTRLPADAPPGVRRLLSRCLQKDPERRLRDAGDAILDLEDPAERAPVPAASRHLWPAVALTAACAGLGGAAAVYLASGARAPGPIAETRFSIDMASQIHSMAFSPDGRTLVYGAGAPPGDTLLFLRHFDSFESVPIPGTALGIAPFFSPDGRWIGYCAAEPGGRSTLKRVPADGGPVQAVTAHPDFVRDASWADDNSIVFSTPPGTLWRIPASGGEPVAIGTPPDRLVEAFGQPEVLPGSRHVLFTCWRRDGLGWRPRVEAISIGTGERRVVVADGSQPHLAWAIGVLMFYQGGSLMAAPMDVPGLALTGGARPVIGPLVGDESGASARYAVSGDGTLAFLPGAPRADDTDLAWFGVDGASTTVYRGADGIRTLRLSPGGARVAFSTATGQLWVLDLERRTTIRLTGAVGAAFPVWTPDGARIAFQRDDQDGSLPRIEWTPADGSGAPELLYTHPDGAKCFPTDFSPDGGVLLISANTGSGDLTDVFLVRLDGDRTPRPLLDTRADRVGARFSPDGTMVAYCSSETGREEIYIHPFPALDRKVRVSIDGGLRPAWSIDGTRLFYRSTDKIHSAEVSPPPQFTVGHPAVVLDSLPGMRYDAFPDGTRFIMGRPRHDFVPQTRINVVTGALARRPR